jgi:hypothetical protein
MGKIICYRIDHREFKEGDIITSPGDHIDRLNDLLKAAELRLRGFSQEKAELRAGSLYAFTNLEWSKKYFLGKTGFLYELEVDETNVVHVADMMLVNLISEAEASDEDSAISFAKQYWAGGRGNGERIEILATEAVVKKLMHTAADKVILKNQLYK